jgi:hypothetical protein
VIINGVFLKFTLALNFQFDLTWALKVYYEKLSIIETLTILLAIQLELCTLECESQMQILVQN